MVSEARKRSRTDKGQPADGARALSITVDGHTVTIDPAAENRTTMTFREIAVAKQALKDAGFAGTDDGTLWLAVIAWTKLRAALPDLAFADLIDAFGPGDFEIAGDVEAGEDPES
jgi:hypothetical protein